MNGSGSNVSTSGPEARRSFLTQFATLIIGGVVTLFPFAAGLGVFMDPLRRRKSRPNGSESEAARFVRVCSLDALPADGIPRQFAVTADSTDAWTRTIRQRIGSIFLARATANDKPEVSAFSATCPHLGCSVEFDAADDRFECPCHESAFSKQGEMLFGPSQRGLDSLEVKLIENEDQTEVWVAYEKFLAGIAERIPVG